MNCKNKKKRIDPKTKKKNYLPSGNRQAPSLQDHPKPPTKIRYGKAPLKEEWSPLSVF